MNIYGAKQLADSFRTVRKNTIQVAEDIPESQYGFVGAPGTRPVAHILAHVATSTSMWQDIHGTKKLIKMDDYDFFGGFAKMEAEEKKQRSKAQTIEMLRTEGEKFAAFLEGLSDQTLGEEIVEFGGAAKKSRLEALMSAKEHEMHHRAQLMLIERLLGIVPHLTRRYEDMERQYEEYKQKQAAPQPA